MQADLAGKHVVLSTAAGVCGLQRYRRAPRLYAASLVCARATAEAIRAAGAKEVCFVITGEWVDRDGDEDIACADYIQSLLSGDQPAPEEFAQRVRNSDFGQRFTAGTWPNLPLADLDLAAQPDLFNFAMPVISEDEQLIIRRTSAATFQFGAIHTALDDRSNLIYAVSHERTSRQYSPTHS